MKDPSDSLLTKIYTALNGLVTYNAVTIPVYTVPVNDDDRTADHYIRIDTLRLIEDGAKDRFISEGTVDIYIYSFFTGRGIGSKLPVDTISSSVAQLLDTTFVMTGYNQIVGRVEAIESFDYELDPAGFVFTKLITYAFKIEQT